MHCPISILTTICFLKKKKIAPCISASGLSFQTTQKQVNYFHTLITSSSYTVFFLQIMRCTFIYVSKHSLTSPYLVQPLWKIYQSRKPMECTIRDNARNVWREKHEGFLHCSKLLFSQKMIKNVMIVIDYFSVYSSQKLC